MTTVDLLIALAIAVVFMVGQCVLIVMLTNENELLRQKIRGYRHGIISPLAPADDETFPASEGWRRY